MKTIVLISFVILPLLIISVFSAQVDLEVRDVFAFCNISVCDTDDASLSFSTHSPYALEFRVSTPSPGLSGNLVKHEQINTDLLLAFRKEKPPRFI